MGAVSGAELSGAELTGAELTGADAGGASAIGEVSGAVGTANAGRLDLLRRSAPEAGSPGADVGAVGTSVVGIASVGFDPAFPSASGIVGVSGLLMNGSASARCRPARKGRDLSRERDMVASQRLRS